MIDRIAKLLHQAERAATPEEAQVYFDKAQTLATSHSISLAKARLHTAERSRRAAPVNRTVTIGEPRRHANRHLVMLMHAVARANDLEMDVAGNSTHVILYGFPGDIATSEVLWGNISTQMVRFAEAYLATDDWRDERRLVRHGPDRGWGNMTRQTARATYYQSYIATVDTRLQTAREEQVAAAEHRDQQERAHGGAAAVSTAIALREKSLAVTGHYARESTARGRWGGGRSSVVGLSDSARLAGRRDAHRTALGAHTALSGPKGQLPR